MQYIRSPPYVTELGPAGGCKRLMNLRIICLVDSTYSVGSKCFLPSDEVEHDEVLPRIDIGIYSGPGHPPGRAKITENYSDMRVQRKSARNKLLANVDQRELTFRGRDHFLILIAAPWGRDSPVTIMQ